MRVATHEYRALDAYRFLAAALVAVGHFDDGFQLGLERFSPLAVRFGLFVDFFFILSGFVIGLNYQGRITSASSYGDFIWRRLARLWPLHLLVLVFFGSLGLAGHMVGYVFNYPETFALQGFPWNIVLMQAWGPVWHQSFNVASWSISAEFFVYLLFPLFAWQARRLPLAVNLALIVGFVAAMIWLRSSAGLRPWYQATYDLGMLRAVPSFLLGVLIQWHVTRLQPSPAWARWPLAHAVFGLALAAIHFNLPSEIVIVLFGVFVVVAVLAEQSREPTLLSGPRAQFLGQMSYGLYMVHMPLMTCSMFVIRKTTGYGGYWGFAFAIFTFALALGIAALLYHHLENPLRQWLNARSPFRRPAASAPVAAT